MSFAELLKAVDEVEGIERVRYMTSHPKDLSDEVIEAVKNGRHICEHFHIPVQYGTDKLLKRMNRKYTVAQYKALVERIRHPGCKYDYMVVLDGIQGLGKSMFFTRLSFGFYTDTLSLQDMNNLQKAFEQTQGAWIVEISELAGA